MDTIFGPLFGINQFNQTKTDRGHPQHDSVAKPPSLPLISLFRHAQAPYCPSIFAQVDHGKVEVVGSLRRHATPHYATPMWRLCFGSINRSTAKHVQVSSPFSTRPALDLWPSEIRDYNVTDGMVTDPFCPSASPRCGMQRVSTNSVEPVTGTKNVRDTISFQVTGRVWVGFVFG